MRAARGIPTSRAARAVALAASMLLLLPWALAMPADALAANATPTCHDMAPAAPAQAMAGTPRGHATPPSPAAAAPGSAPTASGPPPAPPDAPAPSSPRCAVHCSTAAHATSTALSWPAPAAIAIGWPAQIASHVPGAPSRATATPPRDRTPPKLTTVLRL